MTLQTRTTHPEGTVFFNDLYLEGYVRQAALAGYVGELIVNGNAQLDIVPTRIGLFPGWQRPMGYDVYEDNQTYIGDYQPKRGPHESHPNWQHTNSRETRVKLITPNNQAPQKDPLMKLELYRRAWLAPQDSINFITDGEVTVRSTNAAIHRRPNTRFQEGLVNGFATLLRKPLEISTARDTKKAEKGIIPVSLFVARVLRRQPRRTT